MTADFPGLQNGVPVLQNIEQRVRRFPVKPIHCRAALPRLAHPGPARAASFLLSLFVPLSASRASGLQAQVQFPPVRAQAPGKVLLTTPGENIGPGPPEILKRHAFYRN